MLVVVSMSAQNFGFYGKKNIVDLQVGFYTPFILKWDNGFGSDNFYKASGTQLIKKKDRVELAYSLNYFRSLSNKTSIGIEFGFQSLDTETPTAMYRYNSASQSGEYVEGKIEQFKFTHFSFIPKFEFSKKDGIFGMGIKHQLGFGFARTTFVQKEYVFDLVNQDSWGADYPLSDTQKAEFKSTMYDFTNNKFKNLILFYALNFRKPLSKSLFLNYGFKYTLNFRNSTIGYINDNNTYWIDNSQIANLVRQDRLHNVVTFKMGVSYAF